MRGAVVSIQIAVLMPIILAIAIALAAYLYTTLYSSLQYTYIAVTQAYVYPREVGSEVKVCFITGGSGGLEITNVELNGKIASNVRIYVNGSVRDVIKAGDVGYIKAYFPDVTVVAGQMPVGRVVTSQGFSFIFTPIVSNSEGACPGG